MLPASPAVSMVEFLVAKRRLEAAAAMPSEAVRRPHGVVFQRPFPPAGDFPPEAVCLELLSDLRGALEGLVLRYAELDAQGKESHSQSQASRDRANAVHAAPHNGANAVRAAPSASTSAPSATSSASAPPASPSDFPLPEPPMAATMPARSALAPRGALSLSDLFLAHRRSTERERGGTPYSDARERARAEADATEPDSADGSPGQGSSKAEGLVRAPGAPVADAPPQPARRSQTRILLPGQRPSFTDRGIVGSADWSVPARGEGVDVQSRPRVGLGPAGNPGAHFSADGCDSPDASGSPISPLSPRASSSSASSSSSLDASASAPLVYRRPLPRTPARVSRGWLRARLLQRRGTPVQARVIKLTPHGAVLALPSDIPNAFLPFAQITTSARAQWRDGVPPRGARILVCLLECDRARARVLASQRAARLALFARGLEAGQLLRCKVTCADIEEGAAGVGRGASHRAVSAEEKEEEEEEEGDAPGPVPEDVATVLPPTHYKRGGVLLECIRRDGAIAHVEFLLPNDAIPRDLRLRSGDRVNVVVLTAGPNPTFLATLPSASMPETTFTLFPRRVCLKSSGRALLGRFGVVPESERGRRRVATALLEGAARGIRRACEDAARRAHKRGGAAARSGAAAGGTGAGAEDEAEDEAEDGSAAKRLAGSMGRVPSSNPLADVASLLPSPRFSLLTRFSDVSPGGGAIEAWLSPGVGEDAGLVVAVRVGQEVFQSELGGREAPRGRDSEPPLAAFLRLGGTMPFLVKRTQQGMLWSAQRALERELAGPRRGEAGQVALGERRSSAGDLQVDATWGVHPLLSSEKLPGVLSAGLAVQLTQWRQPQQSSEEPSGAEANEAR